MSLYSFDLAKESDDLELRQLMKKIVTPGNIELKFCREPNFFNSLASEGTWHQVMVVRYGDHKEIVGCGVRSVQKLIFNGEAITVGYLSALRLAHEHQGLGLTIRAYRFFRELHQDNRASFYLTTIAHGNDSAKKLLTAGIKDMPRYHSLGDFSTLAIPVKRRYRFVEPMDLEIRTADSEDSSEIISFLNKEGKKRTFSNLYQDKQIFNKNHLFKLKASDVSLAYKKGKLVGVLGGWDQHSFRQVVVCKYNNNLKYWRWLHDIIQKLKGAKKLPKPGKPFHYLLGTLCYIQDWNPDIFCALLEHQLMKNSQAQYHFYLVGMHETEPLLTIARKYASIEYKTGVYLVSWTAPPLLSTHITRPLHLELGCL
jgi:hypothetical protein